MSDLVYLASPYSHPDAAIRQARYEMSVSAPSAPSAVRSELELHLAIERECQRLMRIGVGPVQAWDEAEKRSHHRDHREERGK